MAFGPRIQAKRHKPLAVPLGYTVTLKNNDGRYYGVGHSRITLLRVTVESATVSPGTTTTPTTVASSAPTQFLSASQDLPMMAQQVTASWTPPSVIPVVETA